MLWSSLFLGVVMLSTKPPEKSQQQRPEVSKHVVFDRPMAVTTGMGFWHLRRVFAEPGPVSQRLALDLWQWAVKSAFPPLASCRLTRAGAVAGQIWCCMVLQRAKARANRCQSAPEVLLSLLNSTVPLWLPGTIRNHQEPSGTFVEGFSFYFVREFVHYRSCKQSPVFETVPCAGKAIRWFCWRPLSFSWLIPSQAHCRMAFWQRSWQLYWFFALPLHTEEWLHKATWFGQPHASYPSTPAAMSLPYPKDTFEIRFHHDKSWRTITNHDKYESWIWII